MLKRKGKAERELESQYEPLEPWPESKELKNAGKEIMMKEFISYIQHFGWCCFQIGVKQEYNEYPTNDQLKSLVNGVDAFLDNPNMTPEKNHENWMKQKKENGWVFGLVKDVEKKTHPDLVPFDKLPEAEKLKDTMDNMIRKQALWLWSKMVKE